jgi:hypothetical protein
MTFEFCDNNSKALNSIFFELKKEKKRRRREDNVFLSLKDKR